MSVSCGQEVPLSTNINDHGPPTAAGGWTRGSPTSRSPGRPARARNDQGTVFQYCATRCTAIARTSGGIAETDHLTRCAATLLPCYSVHTNHTYRDRPHLIANITRSAHRCHSHQLQCEVSPPLASPSSLHRRTVSVVHYCLSITEQLNLL
jgi:hypothetical protein